MRKSMVQWEKEKEEGEGEGREEGTIWEEMGTEWREKKNITTPDHLTSSRTEAVFKHGPKFFGTLPIKNWALCPFPLNLNRFLTTFTSRICQKWSYAISKIRSLKAKNLPSGSFGVFALWKVHLRVLPLGAQPPHWEKPKSHWEVTCRCSSQQAQLSSISSQLRQ